MRVPSENRVGEEGEGFTIAMSAIDQGRYTVATGAVGLAQACLDASLRYAHERRTFGEEIGRHQLVKQMIAKMGAGIEAGRLLCRQAAWLKNRGERNTRETSLAKWSRPSTPPVGPDAIQITAPTATPPNSVAYTCSLKGSCQYRARPLHTLSGPITCSATARTSRSGARRSRARFRPSESLTTSPE